MSVPFNVLPARFSQCACWGRRKKPNGRVISTASPLFPSSRQSPLSVPSRYHRHPRLCRCRSPLRGSATSGSIGVPACAVAAAVSPFVFLVLFVVPPSEADCPHHSAVVCLFLFTCVHVPFLPLSFGSCHCEIVHHSFASIARLTD
jgi:hypothetical protein